MTCVIRVVYIINKSSQEKTSLAITLAGDRISVIGISERIALEKDCRSEERKN